MSNPIYLLVGKSASGKTTIAEILEKELGFKSIQSYTTRAPRYEGETGHTFITDDEFDLLENIIGYTEYNGHRYCCTKEQIDGADLYVIDVPGVETLLERYNSDRLILIIYFDASIRTRIDRMLDRHDSDMAIVSRLYTDEEFDWEKVLSKLVWNYKNNMNKNVEMYILNANVSLEEVLKQVKNYMNIAEEKHDSCV